MRGCEFGGFDVDFEALFADVGGGADADGVNGLVEIDIFIVFT